MGVALTYDAVYIFVTSMQWKNCMSKILSDSYCETKQKIDFGCSVCVLEHANMYRSMRFFISTIVQLMEVMVTR